MRIIPDTNVLIRFIVDDDPAQSLAVRRLFLEATLIAISTACLCEFVWVIRSVYKRSRSEASLAIQELFDSDIVVCDRDAVAAGLAALDAGGDFADGVIAYEGRVLGGETFVSFDRRAVALVEFQGGRAVRLE